MWPECRSGGRRVARKASRVGTEKIDLGVGADGRSARRFDGLSGWLFGSDVAAQCSQDPLWHVGNRVRMQHPKSGGGPPNDVPAAPTGIDVAPDFAAVQPTFGFGLNSKRRAPLRVMCVRVSGRFACPYHSCASGYCRLTSTATNLTPVGTPIDASGQAVSGASCSGSPGVFLASTEPQAAQARCWGRITDRPKIDVVGTVRTDEPKRFSCSPPLRGVACVGIGDIVVPLLTGVVPAP